MKFTFTFFVLLLTLDVYALKDSSKKVFNLPGPHIALGFTNRLCESSNERMELRFVNVGNNVNDTFNYDGKLKASGQLITFNFGISGTYKYFGAKIDFGIAPFVNRNYNINLTTFALIPLHRDVTIAAEFGYTRIKKKRVLGSIETDDERKIELKGAKYDELYFMTHHVDHSYFYGLGAYINLGLNYHLYLSAKYHTSFQSIRKLKVAGRSYDDSEPFLSEIISYEGYELYGLDDQSIRVKNSKGQNITQFYNIGMWSFSAQFCIPLGDLQGHPHTFHKFMGAQ